MCRNFFKVLVLIAPLTILFSLCSKDDDSSNSTNGKTTAIFNSDISYGTMTDQEGNSYKTVIIGSQTWMAENLRTTTYNDGTNIPNITGDEWGDLTTGAYCNYNNTTDKETIATYGRLYNWHAVNTELLAPKGWHVPTDAEWTTLTTYLGDPGGELKETDTTHWNYPNNDATNETGFTALPGGYRYIDGYFHSFGYYGTWWSFTEHNTLNAWYRIMSFDYSYVGSREIAKEFGFSVRCVRD